MEEREVEEREAEEREVAERGVDPGNRLETITTVSHPGKPLRRRTARVEAQFQPSSRASSREGPLAVGPERMSLGTGSSELSLPLDELHFERHETLGSTEADILDTLSAWLGTDSRSTFGLWPSAGALSMAHITSTTTR